MSAVRRFSATSMPLYDEVELLCREVEARFGRRPLTVTYGRIVTAATSKQTADSRKGEAKAPTR